MEKEVTKIKCNLIVRGSDESNASAKADLKIQDPDQDRALAIINEALGDKKNEQDEQRAAS